jgi:hypothetical protein
MTNSDIGQKVDLWRAKIKDLIKDITEMDDAAATIIVFCEALAEASLLAGLSMEQLTAMLEVQRGVKLDMVANHMVETLLVSLLKMERPN